jgi:23S rRNA G2445 N2-methylase RlmL
MAPDLARACIGRTFAYDRRPSLPQAARFPPPDFDALFEGVRSVPWEHLFPKTVRVLVDKVRTHSTPAFSERLSRVSAHKAIYGARVGVDDDHLT